MTRVPDCVGPARRLLYWPTMKAFILASCFTFVTGCVVGTAEAPPEDNEGADIGDDPGLSPDVAGFPGCTQITTVSTSRMSFS